MPFRDGLQYTSGGALLARMRPAVVPPTALYRDALARDSDGYAYLESAGDVVPSGAQYRNGMAFTPDGALYVTGDLPNSTTRYRGGVAIRVDGAVHVIGGTPTLAPVGGEAISSSGQIYVSISDFYLPLADAGSGAVDTNLVGGTGSATFTRATTATTVNSAGLIVSVGSGVARSYYDPTTLQYQGYLPERARTNLFLNSLIDGTDASTQSITVTNVAHTLSFYGTGTITLSGVSTAGPLVGTGVYPQRVQLTFTPTAGSLTLTVTGSCKFAQLEIGSFASSFIPTAGVAVTRDADVLTYPSTGNVSATQGTMYAEYTAQVVNAALFRQILSITDGTANERFNLAQIAADGAADQYIVVDGSVSQASPDSGAIVANTTYKKAACWALNDFSAARNGTLTTQDTSGTLPTIDRIEIGMSAGATQSFMPIKNVRIWTTQFSSAQLSAITA